MIDDNLVLAPPQDLPGEMGKPVKLPTNLTGKLLHCVINIFKTVNRKKLQKNLVLFRIIVLSFELIHEKLLHFWWFSNI